MKILAIRDFAIVSSTHDEISEMVGSIDLGSKNVCNGYLHGILTPSQYHAGDFYYMELGLESRIKDFFKILDSMADFPNQMGYEHYFEKSKIWTDGFLKSIRESLNENAGSVFFDNGSLDNLPNDFYKNDFILVYLKISQAINFAKNGLVQFTDQENNYTYME